MPVVPVRLSRPQPARRSTLRPARSWRPVAVLGALGLLAGCTGGPVEGTGETPAADAVVLRSAVALPDAATTVVPDGSAAATALAVSGALFAEAPVAVVVADDDPAVVAPAASAAVALGSPVLLAGKGLADELDRLGTTDAVVVAAAPAERDELAEALPDGVRQHPLDAADPARADLGAALADLGLEVGDEQDVDPARLLDAVVALERPAPAVLVAAPAEPDPAPTATRTPAPTSSADRDRDRGNGADESQDAAPAEGSTPGQRDVLGLATTTIEAPEGVDDAALLVDSRADAAGTAVAAATARAAGVPVVDVPDGDPRARSATVQALTGVATVVAVGSTFGDAARLGPRVASAATGVELPGGGQLVFPTGGAGKRYVALYGTPGTPALGVLGEQDVPATIARARDTAAPYDALTDATVVPTLEIIATVASAAPEPDGSYSRPRTVDELRPLVEAAGEAGQAVVIDLQPGRTDFVTQAQQYAELLAYPHVGLALDPEWRLKPDQVHLRQIGSVGVDEVNATADWLARFTRDHELPQKMFLLHQFSLRMITDRERLDTGHDGLAVIIHADGQGSQPAKAGTWATLRQGAPDVHWGWKNFYDEDTPMLDPAQTYAVQPTPDLVTYQ